MELSIYSNCKHNNTSTTPGAEADSPKNDCKKKEPLETMNSSSVTFGGSDKVQLDPMAATNNRLK